MCASSQENAEIVKEYVDNCIEWLITAEHNGFNSNNEIVTIN